MTIRFWKSKHNKKAQNSDITIWLQKHILTTKLKILTK